MTVQGLPYAHSALSTTPTAVMSHIMLSWSNQLAGYIGESGSTISLKFIQSGGGWGSATHNAGTARYLLCNGTYIT